MGAFNFDEFKPKKISLSEIFSNNPQFLSKLSKEKSKLKKSLENIGSYESKPNFDLFLKRNKHNKVTEYTLVIQNEKNLLYYNDFILFYLDF